MWHKRRLILLRGAGLFQEGRSGRIRPRWALAGSKLSARAGKVERLSRGMQGTATAAPDSQTRWPVCRRIVSEELLLNLINNHRRTFGALNRCTLEDR